MILELVYLHVLLESLVLEMFVNICMLKFLKIVYLIFNVSDQLNVPNIFMDSDVWIGICNATK